MGKLQLKERKVLPNNILDMFAKHGTTITVDQAVEITEFVYTIAETLTGRSFSDPATRRNIKKRKTQ